MLSPGAHTEDELTLYNADVLLCVITPLGSSDVEPAGVSEGKESRP